MRRVLSTYRVQLHRGFTLRDARAVVPYLHALGVTHLYASPILAAHPGSPHGYDVVDPTRLNPELGTPDDLAALAEALRARGMGLVLDIVPNHMATAPENRRWDDVLAHGPASASANWFDVDWRSPERHLHARVLLPILGAPLGAVLASGELRVAWEGGELRVRYHGHSLPLDPATLPHLLGPAAEACDARLGPGHPDATALRGVLELVRGLPRRTARGRKALARRRDDAALAARLLRELAEQSAVVRECLERAATGFTEGVGGSDRMRRLLDAQAYRLVYWRRAAREINYRRFFDINDLVAVNIGDPAVLARSHACLLEWARDGVLDGFRIDHPDGLLDPRGYLRRLREALAAVGRGSELPPGAAAGAAGRGDIGGPAARGPGAPADHRRAGRRRDRGGDRGAPGLPHLRRPRDPGGGWRRPPDHRGGAGDRPAAAKGIEDTAFYAYGPLLSRNEVGGEPDAPLEEAVADFHRANARRAERRPGTMLAGSTHDTKRSADLRARLDVLSEVPGEWEERVYRWRRLNRRHRLLVHRRSVPNPHTECFLPALGRVPGRPGVVRGGRAPAGLLELAGAGGPPAREPGSPRHLPGRRVLELPPGRPGQPAAGGLRPAAAIARGDSRRLAGRSRPAPGAAARAGGPGGGRSAQAARGDPWTYAPPGGVGAVPGRRIPPPRFGRPASRSGGGVPAGGGRAEGSRSGWVIAIAPRLVRSILPGPSAAPVGTGIWDDTAYGYPPPSP
ncbi:MAG TPA: alpha-amylase family glycosyl hydrolase [Gemmatimonadales bacterium]|nr:alpha-amylase family glycosyl hydrolase [Gemmatimonadales bacterium]